MADATDSKSVGGNFMWVRLPPSAPYTIYYFNYIYWWEESTHCEFPYKIVRFLRLGFHLQNFKYKYNETDDICFFIAEIIDLFLLILENLNRHSNT